MKRLILLLALALPALAQMTPAQREFDFRVMAANLSRYYAPSDWKRQLFGFDMFDLRPWLEKIRNAKDDLDYYEVCSEYIASLGDSHTSYSLPSTFVAATGLHVDIYDGKLIIDNDGLHPPRIVEGSAHLSRGIHQIHIAYFQGPRTHVALVMAVAPPEGNWRYFDTDDFLPPADPAQWFDGKISRVKRGENW